MARILAPTALIALALVAAVVGFFISWSRSDFVARLALGAPTFLVCIAGLLLVLRQPNVARAVVNRTWIALAILLLLTVATAIAWDFTLTAERPPDPESGRLIAWFASTITHPFVNRLVYAAAIGVLISAVCHDRAKRANVMDESKMIRLPITFIVVLGGVGGAALGIIVSQYCPMHTRFGHTTPAERAIMFLPWDEERLREARSEFSPPWTVGYGYHSGYKRLENAGPMPFHQMVFGTIGVLLGAGAFVIRVKSDRAIMWLQSVSTGLRLRDYGIPLVVGALVVQGVMCFILLQSNQRWLMLVLKSTFAIVAWNSPLIIACLVGVREAQRLGQSELRAAVDLRYGTLLMLAPALIAGACTLAHASFTMPDVVVRALHSVTSLGNSLLPALSLAFLLAATCVARRPTNSTRPANAGVLAEQ